MTQAWVKLLSGTGDDFPQVLKCVKPFLVPMKRGGHWTYRFIRKAGGTELLTEKYPETVLELLDAIVPDTPELVPYRLFDILELIKSSNPNLEGDGRFNRLMDIVDQL